MRRVGTHEAKTRLSELLRAVEAGEEIEILRGRDVIAEDAGVFTVPDDFDAPLHRDPFDRLLVAQAQALGIPIVTADDQFAPYDVEIVKARG